jgi:O-antigen ligase
MREFLQKRGLPTELRILAVPALMTAFFLSMRNMTERIDNLAVARPGEVIYWQLATMLFVFGISVASYRKNLPKLNGLALLAALLILYLIVSLFVSIDPAQSALFLCGFLAFVASMPAFWTLDPGERRTSYVLAALGMLLASAYLFATLPLTDRSVAEIPANHFSHGAALAMALIVMSEKKYGFALLVPPILLLGFANGRAAMASISMFFMVLLVLRWRTMDLSRIRNYAAAFLAAVICILIFFREGAYSFLLETLALGDPRRGLGTGFTGRTFFWSQTGEVTRGSELFGLGIGTREVLRLEPAPSNNLHSGFLNAYAELGAIGLTIYVAVLLIAGFIWLRRARSGSFEAACAAAYMISMVPLLVFRPGYISFWDPPLVVMWALVAGAAVRMAQADQANGRRQLMAVRIGGLGGRFKTLWSRGETTPG